MARRDSTPSRLAARRRVRVALAGNKTLHSLIRQLPRRLRRCAIPFVGGVDLLTAVRSKGDTLAVVTTRVRRRGLVGLRHAGARGG